MGFTEKLEYRPRCTTANLPACNDTIIVLKIIQFHSVSVITNCVIPKRNKQTNKQTKSHFFVYSWRATHDPTILGMMIEEVRTNFAPLTFLIQSVVSPLGAIEI